MEIKVRGRLGNDPEVKTVGAENLPVVTFSLAHTPRSKKNGEWVDGDTQWFRVSMFGKRAQALGQTAKKGDEVLVLGTLKMNQYTDANGQARGGWEISATDIGLIPKIARTELPTKSAWDSGW